MGGSEILACLHLYVTVGLPELTPFPWDQCSALFSLCREGTGAIVKSCVRCQECTCPCKGPGLWARAPRALGLEGPVLHHEIPWDVSRGSCGAEGLWAQWVVVACWTWRALERPEGLRSLWSCSGLEPGPPQSQAVWSLGPGEYQSLTSQKLSVVSSGAREASS